jgi:RNA polymerase sigma-70 factor (ECF subfamily)
MHNVTSESAGTSPAELFERHRRALRSYFRSATANPDLADELVQDLYLRVVQSASSYESRGRERAWLFSIARHLVIDHARRRGIERADVVELLQPATQTLRCSLTQALGRLAEHEREAFLLCEVGGLSYAEIGEALGLTVGAVRSLLYRARLTLRALVLPPPIVSSATVVRGDDDHD